MSEPKSWQAIKRWVKTTYGTNEWQNDPVKMTAFYRWWIDQQTPHELFDACDQLTTVVGLHELMLRALSADSDAEKVKAHAAIGAWMMRGMRDAARGELEIAIAEGLE